MPLYNGASGRENRKSLLTKIESAAAMTVLLAVADFRSCGHFSSPWLGWLHNATVRPGGARVGGVFQRGAMLHPVSGGNTVFAEADRRNSTQFAHLRSEIAHRRGAAEEKKLSRGSLRMSGLFAAFTCIQTRGTAERIKRIFPKGRMKRDELYGASRDIALCSNGVDILADILYFI